MNTDENKQIRQNDDSNKQSQKKCPKLLIWEAWLIIFNLISVLLAINLTSFGEATFFVAFIYMAAFGAGGRFLCFLWTKYISR